MAVPLVSTRITPPLYLVVKTRGSTESDSSRKRGQQAKRLRSWTCRNIWTIEYSWTGSSR